MESAFWDSGVGDALGQPFPLPRRLGEKTIAW
jgi:hypothetical protein